MKKALIIVDVQNDFVEGGSLAVTGGLKVAAAIADHLDQHAEDYAYIVASRDWHTDGETNGGHFASPGTDPDYTNTWPVHCVADTHGAEFAPPLAEALDRHVDSIVDKGMGEPAYSAFQGITDSGLELARLLHALHITDVDVCGIATDYCVQATALDAVEEGFAPHLLPGLHAGVDPTTSAEALGRMAGRGVEVRESIFR